ncbi:hypothetical protein A2V49_00950 [candidate division WWE3 bacterium RBG_19FT_COMBO_34_6]|uniref:UDP-N-acetylglucosamine--N-acetylmuramyl-(pentapeptide) pyrophosphoryl-undecaprenol N-acetylglucosamine transferase n=1 Tax=candidate division WWE3 bacterium RBG_19FT_COMBO_34_6 TaxID=1802612 RepID=A0A1F4UKT7_UNCKA|nr:MAG: hypothetical protein A2V49_00950 [candidate division WWE3 bacterium RBG_19FT_COMBO_34_6]
MKKIVITGGHHSSAIPVIYEIKKRYNDVEIYWFGHKHSLSKDKNTTLEYKEITQLGISFFNIHAGKFYNNFNLLRLLKIPLSFIQTFYLLLKIKPDIILSFGGYIAVPVVISGKILHIPSVTHEQTVVIGYANKLISFFVKKIFISWPQSEKYLPKEKVVYTGLPLRPEIFNVQSEYYRFDNKLPIIYITAGKSGSHKINDAVYKILDDLLDIGNVIHQCGDYSRYNDYQLLNEKYSHIAKIHKGKYYLEKFIFSDHIGEVFKKSNLIISRSGAHICYELINLNKPCMLIPIPWVSHNEQYLNANQVLESGLGEIFDEENLNSTLFLETIRKMLINLDKYYVKNNFVPAYNVAEKIVNEIENISWKK